MQNSDVLTRLGWNDHFASAFQPHADAGMTPGRVGVGHRGVFIIYAADGDIPARPSGRLRHHAAGAEDLPAVGDWVAMRAVDDGERAVIHAVLPRLTRFSRKQPFTETIEQVLAANIDTVLCVAALTRDLNVRRMERYLTMGWESGAEPVVLLTKADLCHDRAAVLDVMAPATAGVTTLVTSSITGEGLDGVLAYTRPGRTAVLLGSSGTGKSSLVNRLCDVDELVLDTRADDRGRHATTRRHMIPVPDGGYLIDTPGLRELALWDVSDGLESSFADVAEFTDACRFTDCRHQSEPGCAVLAAVEDGTLDADRLASWRKLQAELGHLERQQDQRAAREHRKKWKAITKEARRRAR